MHVLDHVCASDAVGDRVDNQDIRDVPQNGGLQLVPASGGDERVLRAKNDFEMRELLTG